MNKITVEEVKRLVSNPINIFDKEVYVNLLKGELPLFKETRAIATLCIEQAEELSGMSNIIAGLNQRLFEAYKQRDEFGELVGILKSEVEKWKNQARLATEQTERVAESQGDLHDIAYKEIEQLRAENERLRGALEPLAKIGVQMKPAYDFALSGGESVLWRFRISDELDFRITLFDVVRAAEALSQSPVPAKDDKTNGGWLDIASVPKDGTDVLILDINYEPKVTSDWWHSYANGDGDWENAGVMSDFCPTHWKPLGELPAQPPIDDKQG